LSGKDPRPRKSYISHNLGGICNPKHVGFSLVDFSIHKASNFREYIHEIIYKNCEKILVQGRSHQQIIGGKVFQHPQNREAFNLPYLHPFFHHDR